MRIKADAPEAFRPGFLAAVCGIRLVETPEQAKQFGCAIGASLFLIEFRDGSSVEIPDEFVDLVELPKRAGEGPQ